MAKKLAQTNLEDSTQILDDLGAMPSKIVEAPLDNPKDINDNDKKKKYEADIGQKIDDISQTSGAASNLVQKIEDNLKNVPSAALKANRFFDLLKISQVPMAAPMEQPVAADPMNNQVQQQVPGQVPQSFRGFSELRQFLDSISDEQISQVIQEFANLFEGNEEEVEPGSAPINPQHNVTEGVKDYLENRSRMGDDERNNMALRIYDMLPKANKQQDNPGLGDDQVQTIHKSVPQHMASIITQTSEDIKRIAYNLALRDKPKTGGFNLRKEAQHKSLQNAIMFGPSQTRVDPFTGQLISNWHLVERNKGFGIKIDDVLDIDWETIWRSAVMDKYSRPYRNAKGEWVGGYINKRFEVDRNVPIGNSYQLLPGQKRRPYLPEYGLTEARLEAARTESNKERGYQPSSDGKPFNWKEASAISKKKVK